MLLEIEFSKLPDQYSGKIFLIKIEFLFIEKFDIDMSKIFLGGTEIL